MSKPLDEKIAEKGANSDPDKNKDSGVVQRKSPSRNNQRNLIQSEALQVPIESQDLATQNFEIQKAVRSY